MRINENIIFYAQLIIMAIIIIMFIKGLYHLITGKYKVGNDQLSKKKSRQIGLSLAASLPVVYIIFSIFYSTGAWRDWSMFFAEGISIAVSIGLLCMIIYMKPAKQKTFLFGVLGSAILLVITLVIFGRSPLIGTWTYTHGTIEFLPNSEVFISPSGSGLRMKSWWELEDNDIYLKGVLGIPEYFGELKGDNIIAKNTKVGWSRGEGILLIKK